MPGWQHDPSDFQKDFGLLTDISRFIFSRQDVFNGVEVGGKGGSL